MAKTKFIGDGNLSFSQAVLDLLIKFKLTIGKELVEGVTIECNPIESTVYLIKNRCEK